MWAKWTAPVRLNCTAGTFDSFGSPAAAVLNLSSPMPTMQVFCFEDSLVDRLRPAVLARPAYAVTCGSYRLIDWLKQIGTEVFAEVRPYLRELQKLDFAIASPTAISGGQSVLLVNARLAPTVANLRLMESAIASIQDVIHRDEVDDAVLLAKLTIPSGPVTTLATLLEEAQESRDYVVDAKADVFRWPHDLVEVHMRSMPSALEYRVQKGSYQQLQDGVFVADGVQIGQYAAFDTSEGPVVLDSNVKVGPFCYFSGPVYAGPSTKIIEHAALKDAVSLGHTVKIGGEVEASVIEPYTNKQHHGFLGHSYLGSWINLGAGTCNSDLKNTYGKINVEYGATKMPTGMQFFGCVMGDYSKTAINTSVFTGKIIGVCSMMYGFVTSNVPSYVNYARLFGQTSLLPVDVMISTQARMFARRKVMQRPSDEQLIRDMYALSADERAADAELL
jgi:UDP-N-acetylglucosamine diphosphorylase / glucose-1-phosphate thymidylyltransferase / UDP-N-acetylgalactosamine diphosphorylase / glucosamine-1-phosphate N-acetyltransferase / galactosamine-1-phosphate N-acetyltransferase